MKVTHFGPGGLPITVAGWSTGIVSLNSNVEIIGGGPAALNFVQRITSNTSNTLLNPIVNFASGSNIAFSVNSNTLTITGAAGGAGAAPTISAGSNSTRVSEVSTAGASTTLWSPFDHQHDGIGTITASSSNTMQRGTWNIRPGTGIALSLTDTDGDGEFDTTTISATSAGGAGGAGALIFLEAHTASASASLDFTSFISSTYDDYQIEIITIIPATNSVTLYLRFSTDGGSSYLATSYGWNHVLVYGAGTSAGEGSTSDVAIAVSGAAVASAGYGVSGTLRLYGPGASGTTLKVLTKDTTRDHTSVGLVHDNGSGYRSVAAVNAIRFLFSSGNITSGVIRIYGIAKS